MRAAVPNSITLSRMLGAVCLLFFDVTAQTIALFWVVYAFCGMTDVADGYVARRFNIETKAGELLDSCADVLFLACSAYKLFPFLIFPMWLWMWLGAIVAIKVVNQISASVIYGKFVFPHTFANKLTGLLLFICVPLYVCLELLIPLYIISALATFAAIQEGCFIRKKKS